MRGTNALSPIIEGFPLGRKNHRRLLLRQLYYDSVIYTGATLSSLVEKVGSDHVLLGTDYPFDMGEADPVGLISKTRTLSRTAKEQVWGGNAARLLGIQ